MIKDDTSDVASVENNTYVNAKKDDYEGYNSI